MIDMMTADIPAASSPDNADVFAALERFGKLRETKEAADGLEEQFPGQEAEKAADGVFNATYDAAEAMLRIRPQTIAGLRAIVRALVDLACSKSKTRARRWRGFCLKRPRSA